MDGFFDPLLAVLDHIVREGFVSSASRRLLVVDSTADSLLSKLCAGVQAG